MAAFWRLVGFEQVDPPTGLMGRVAWFEREGTQIHLLWKDDPVAAQQGHVAVVVDDYDAVITRVRQAGYEIREGTPYWGAPRTFARLPGGHLAELMSAPPA